jgi:hypothetical protein
MDAFYARVSARAKANTGMLGLALQAMARRSRRAALRSKNNAWLNTADTVAGW